MKKTLLFIVLFSFCAFSFAQKPRTESVKAKGEWVLSEDISIEKAKEKALFEAKKEAMRIAGVPENVCSVSILSLGNGDDQFKEIASELGRISIDGVVIIKEVEYTTVHDERTQLFKMIASIKADVVVEQPKSDPEFQLEIKGIKNSSYKENEQLNFQLKPYKDCYIRVFWFTSSLDGNGEMIFPYQDFYYDQLFKENQVYTFPLSDPQFVKTQTMVYTIYKEKADLIENNIILIVALKDKRPFIGDVTYENVIRWLSKIDPSEKVDVWYPITIVK